MTIAEIHAHLQAGHEVLIASYTRPIILPDARYIGYIRQDRDGYGFRLGWPGRASLYCFPEAIRLVPAGMTMRQPRKQRRAK